MRVIKIKNVSGSSGTWVGQTIANNAFYTIQTESERVDWARDDTVNQDIWATTAKLEVWNDTHVLTKADGDAWLKGNHIIEEVHANIYSKESDAISDTNIPVSTTDREISFKVPGTAGEEYRYIWGARCFCYNAEAGDYAKFKIVDKDNILGYGAGLVLKEYVKKRWVHDGVVCQQREAAPGEILSGLYMCIYVTTGSTGNTRKFFADLDVYEKD